ncbi:MAG: hypothetical protein M1275_00800 [Patescibacteria group bacterium]|nr:hypothetical protein [Patescibacteria group bacterium]
MMSKRIATVQFSPTSDRHLVAGDGCTACRILIEPKFQSQIKRQPANSVDCWLCRKRGGLLRPFKGKCTTGVSPRGKVHLLFSRRKGGWRTPCNLHFPVRHPAILASQKYSSVTCGHCMRFAFQ